MRFWPFYRFEIKTDKQVYELDRLIEGASENVEELRIFGLAVGPKYLLRKRKGGFKVVAPMGSAFVTIANYLQVYEGVEIKVAQRPNFRVYFALFFVFLGIVTWTHFELDSELYITLLTLPLVLIVVFVVLSYYTVRDFNSYAKDIEVYLTHLF